MKLSKDSLLNFGEATHTAIRKICDSSWTSVAYNAIVGLSSEEWSEYVSYMRGILDRGFYNRSILIQTVANYSKEYFKCKYRGKSNLLIILKICFENFSRNDWEGFCAYLEFRKRNKKKCLR